MSEPTWTLENHCCAECLGRILSRPTGVASAPREYRCSNCGLTSTLTMVTKRSHPAICACARRISGRDAGIRCVVNPAPRPLGMPSEVVAMEVGKDR